MQILRANLETCHSSGGVVVVVDVIRAFTCAAVALARGARAIVPVRTVEEALALRGALPAALVIGEVGGNRPPGFDFGNSPAELLAADLAGRVLVQRTGAGTQGLALAAHAEHLFAASLVCASATARAVLELAPEQVTLVRTGLGQQGEEDEICCDVLEALLRGRQPDAAEAARRVRDVVAQGGFPEASHPHFPADLDLCVDVDRYDFAMPVARHHGRPAIEMLRVGL